MENKFKLGDYVKVDWTDSILKIRRFDENDENSDFCWFDKNCGSIWYHCDAAEFDPYSSSYYCNTPESSIRRIAAEEEFYLQRKESLEYEIERHKEAIKSFEEDIKEIEKYIQGE
jgi:hypothetical protein